MTDSHFFEEDEPLADIRAAWQRGEKGVTRRPEPGFEATWDVKTISLRDVRLFRFEPEDPLNVDGRVKVD